MLFAEGENGPVQVAIFRGQLIFVLLGVLPHSLFQRLCQFFVAALEQGFDIGRRLLIFVLRAEPFNARAETPFEMIFQTGAGKFAVDLDLAGAELEGAVYQIQCVAGERRRQERAVIIRAVADDLSRNDHLRERLIREFQMRVRFIVLEENIEARLMLFDEVRFQDEGLDLVIDDDKFKIGDHFNQLPRLRVLMPARLKILTNAVSQVLCLADVNDLAGGIFMDINTGTRGQGL